MISLTNMKRPSTSQQNTSTTRTAHTAHTSANLICLIKSVEILR